MELVLIALKANTKIKLVLHNVNFVHRILTLKKKQQLLVLVARREKHLNQVQLLVQPQKMTIQKTTTKTTKVLATTKVPATQDPVGVNSPL